MATDTTATKDATTTATSHQFQAEVARKVPKTTTKPTANQAVMFIEASVCGKSMDTNSGMGKAEMAMARQATGSAPYFIEAGRIITV